MKDQTRIVAEITRNWPGNDTPIISKEFEEVIRVNALRGFTLESWKFTAVHIPGTTLHPYSKIMETIIAVFVK
jgi:hypothetical protein